MATTITMPQLGETVTEGTVAQWLKKPGEHIEKYEAFVEVSTDKVNAEVPAPVTGILREIIVKEGETVPTGSPIAVIDETVSETSASAQESPVGDSAPAPAAAAVEAPAPALADLRGASPAVRRLAREHSVDVTRLSGSGANGRVTAKDILAATTSAPAAGTSYARPIPGTKIPLSPARRLIAQRMVESKHTAPHAWTMVEIDVTNLWAWRTATKDAFEREHGTRLTLLPFFIHAVAESLGRYPLMNSTFSDDGIHLHREINVAIAVALPDNLILPVIREADKLSIKGIALAGSSLVDRARRGKIGPDDLAGGTFTVNNTGANGSILSAPIIPIGQAGIVTMEAVVKRPVIRDDAIAIRSMMNACLSIDHRIVDGGIASGFLADLKRRLEAMGPSGPL